MRRIVGAKSYNRVNLGQISFSMVKKKIRKRLSFIINVLKIDLEISLKST